MKLFDYIIVGAGLFGCTFARLMAKRNKKCLLLEKRGEIGGNCITEEINGIHVHRYGPHIFHTDNLYVWNFVNSFNQLDSYSYRVKSFVEGKYYSFPVNLLTLSQMWEGSPRHLINKFEQSRKKIDNPKNFEEQAISNFGREIYELFFKDFTSKQWGRNPKNLPAFIANRIPVRKTFDDSYFDDKFQGMPRYKHLFDGMVDHENIQISLNTDFLENQKYFESIGEKIVFTGSLDDLFKNRFGPLDYRSLSFDMKILERDSYQGSAAIQCPSKDVKYTRIVEHKYLQNIKPKGTVITFEYPRKWEEGKERFYPINSKEENNRHDQYKSLVQDNYLIGGRLAEYRYYNMDETILSAMHLAKNEK